MTDREPVGFTTKKEYAAQHLRELIISGELPSGGRVLQDKVARDLGVSVTPVREAIRQLETEGFLQSTAHVGVRVSQIHREGLDEVYNLRTYLEGELAAEAARRATDEQIARIRQHLERFEEAVKASDRIAARRANYRFHLAIWEVAQRPVTVELVNSLWAKFPWDSLDDVGHRGVEAVKEHRAQLEAIEARDAEASRRAEMDHISISRRYLLDKEQAREQMAGGTGPGGASK